MELYFVTSNAEKVREAKDILGIPIEIAQLELPEIQSLDLEEIVKAKVELAFKKVNKPVFVDDVGLFVETWNGFPGPFVKFMRTAGQTENDLLLRMMQGEKNRDVTARAVIGYSDGDDFHIFHGEVSGVLTTEERGEDGWGFDPIFQPNGYNKTFAQMGRVEKNNISHRHNALVQFKSFLEKYS